MLFYIVLLTLTVLTSATKQQFKTNNRQVYVSWSACGPCLCEYFSIYAFEYATQNPNDMTPPHYLSYSHSKYDSCLSTYQSEWLQHNNAIAGLEISKSGRSAELVTTGLIDSSSNNITVSLSWATQDSDNINNCNCQNIYSYGTESTRISTKSRYRVAEVIGSIKIGADNYPAAADAYGYISDYGQKTVIVSH